MCSWHVSFLIYLLHSQWCKYGPWYGNYTCYIFFLIVRKFNATCISLERQCFHLYHGLWNRRWNLLSCSLYFQSPQLQPFKITVYQLYQLIFFILYCCQIHLPTMAPMWQYRTPDVATRQAVPSERKPRIRTQIKYSSMEWWHSRITREYWAFTDGGHYRRLPWLLSTAEKHTKP